ncbi:hypothetical protein ILT42_21195 [Microvirga sp. BT291]|nr:hypothetical protein [Microvirga pudoricolor]
MGFAPNPFWGICTLANCKPQIRKKAVEGDIVIGTGSSGAKLAGHLIYWMKVEYIMNFDEYWRDPRFRLKRPILNGSKAQQFGDNIYYTDGSGKIRQLDSFHSEPNGVVSIGNLKRDTGRTNRVLAGKSFSYFGKRAPLIPDELRFMVKKGPGHKCRFTNAQKVAIAQWLDDLGTFGLHGEPVRW